MHQSMSSNPFYIDVCEWLIFWALWMKSFILSSLFFNCYWLLSVIMCPAFYVKGYRAWFFYFIYHYRDEIVELLYNWASLKSLFYNTLVYLSRSWKYDRDWHCNNLCYLKKIHGILYTYYWHLNPWYNCQKSQRIAWWKMIWNVSLRTDLALDVMSRIVYRLVEF